MRDMPKEKTPYQKFLEDARKKGYTKSPFNYDGEGRIIKEPTLPEDCRVCGAKCGRVERDICLSELNQL